MLFGQSAGATNVFIVSTLPQAKTLVSSVISESGAGRDLDYAAGVNLIGEDFAKAVNCGTSDVGSCGPLVEWNANVLIRLHVYVQYLLSPSTHHHHKFLALQSTVA